MADKTMGFKVSEHLQERTQMMIAASGLSNKEWFEKVVALAEVQELKEGATEYKEDLAELEAHTTRIYNLIANMIQRSIYLKEQETRDLNEKIEQKEAVLGEYQQKAKDAEEKTAIMKETLDIALEEKAELERNIHELRSSNENNVRLIGEYKEKIDTLSGLVNEYKSYPEEKEKLMESFEAERKQYNSQIEELLDENEVNQETLKELKSTIENLKVTHKADLEQIKAKSDLEKDKAILGVERKHSNEITKLNNDHNKAIKELYNELNSLRKEYEEKINNLPIQQNQKSKKDKSAD